MPTLALVEKVRGTGVVAERLRDYVRARVRKEGAHYQHGAQTTLAKALGVKPAWVSAYVDFPPVVNANIDMALSLCDFYGVNLLDFADGGPRLSSGGSRLAPTDQGGPSDVRRPIPELAVLRARIARLETALQQIADHTTRASELAARALTDAGTRNAQPRRRAGVGKTAR